MIMIINVGSGITTNIFAHIDTPILQKTNAIVYGLCTDKSFACGYNSQFNAYISPNKDRTISRYTGEGGVMYCENVHVMRIHFSFPYLPRMEFMRSVLECIKQTCIDYNLVDSKITELNYLTVNGKKVIGCAYIRANQYRNTTLLISFNLKSFDVESIKCAYLRKNLILLDDLSDTDIPDNFIDVIAYNLGKRFNIEAQGTINENIFTIMKSIHNSPEWIVSGDKWW